MLRRGGCGGSQRAPPHLGLSDAWQAAGTLGQRKKPARPWTLPATKRTGRRKTKSTQALVQQGFAVEPDFAAATNYVARRKRLPAGRPGPRPDLGLGGISTRVPAATIFLTRSVTGPVCPRNRRSPLQISRTE